MGGGSERNLNHRSPNLETTQNPAQISENFTPNLAEQNSANSKSNSTQISTLSPNLSPNLKQISPQIPTIKFAKISAIIKAKPPFFIGSQIRGGLGYALRRVSCINPKQRCDGCFAQSSCVYFDFYERKNTAHDFRLGFCLGAPIYNFDIFLFDKSARKLPYIAAALDMLLRNIGLGAIRAKFAHYDLFVNDANARKNGQICLGEDFLQDFCAGQNLRDFKIIFRTPLRIKSGGTLLRENRLNLDILLDSIHKRYLAILGQDLSNFPRPLSGAVSHAKLHFTELTRYSNRQQTAMNLGGLMGEIAVQNASDAEWAWLRLGELIGVGKQTAFGLGNYEIRGIDENN